MNVPLLAATIGLLVALAAACVLPVCADSTDDRGDGRAAVVIPRHVPTTRFRPRTWVFLVPYVVLSLLAQASTRTASWARTRSSTRSRGSATRRSAWWAPCRSPGFSWFSLQIGLVAPILMLELVLTHPSHRQNLATFALVYLAAGAVSAAISVPLAVKRRQWRSLPWILTWFAYAFLRRLGTLEAAMTLPVRPLPVAARVRSVQPPRPLTLGNGYTFPG